MNYNFQYCPGLHSINISSLTKRTSGQQTKEVKFILKIKEVYTFNDIIQL